MRPCDIAIVGGGPAGSAAALALRQLAPDIEVRLFEASRFEAYRPGEILAPHGARLLAELGVGHLLQSGAARPVPGLLALWDGDVAVERHAMQSAEGIGWFLDRAVFDRQLAESARLAGAALHVGCRVAGVRPADIGWSLLLADRELHRARLVILATGRRWGLARQIDARLAVGDRMGCALRVVSSAGGYPGLVIEAVRTGWWYTLPLPDGRRVVAMAGDRAGGVKDDVAWRSALSGTALVRQMVGPGPALHATLYPAACIQLRPAAGEGWIAAGDAAAALDPLSGQGLLRALGSGVLAARVAIDALAGRTAATERYARLAARRADADMHARAEHYNRVRRWPSSEFWKRRFVDIERTA